MQTKFDEVPDNVTPFSWCNSTGGFSPEGGYLFGMFEIECKLSSTLGRSNAFWVQSNNSRNPEIDIFEYGHGHPNYNSSTIHYPDPNQNFENQVCANYFNYPYDLSDDWHTWTMV